MVVVNISVARGSKLIAILSKLPFPAFSEYGYL